MTGLWLKANTMGQPNSGQNNSPNHSLNNGQPESPLVNEGFSNGELTAAQSDRQQTITADFFSTPIYGRDRSPADPAAQASVDLLIDFVNEQIELLAFDNPPPFLLRQMVQCLIDPRRSTRLNLVESFSQIGEPATPFLVEGIASHSESVVRRACCNALSNIGDPDAVPVLIESLLHDPDIGVKSAAAGALAKVGAPAFEALRNMLASEEVSESCKGHAAWAIASMSSEISDRLYRVMNDPSAAVRTAVIGAIAQLVQKQTAQRSEQPPIPLEVGQPQKGQLHSQLHGQLHSQLQATAQKNVRPRADKIQRALTMLTEALNDHSSEVRIEAVATLARLNCQKAYQPIIACLKDPIAAVRKSAALALAKLGNPDAIEAIEPLQRDVEESVQRVAMMAIAQLKARKPN